MPRYLVTTADERTWKFDRPVLFLGEWCRRYDRRHLWSTMDIVVAEPYGLNEGQKDRDFAYVEKLAAALLVELRDVLNRYHGTSHSSRYWRILLGHWLYRYTSVIFNRFFTLDQTLRNHEVSCITVFKQTSYSLATPDSRTFTWACNDDVWNNILYARILSFVPGAGIQTEPVGLEDVNGFRKGDAGSTLSVANRLKRSVLDVLNRISPLLCRKRDAFIINSYLPRKDEVMLQLRLGQTPQLWRPHELVTVEPNRSLRQGLAATLSPGDQQGFEHCVRALLIELLPTCFLEGYQSLQDQVRNLPWPEKPKFIFTSNNFDEDELFKAWAGLKVEEGISYYTGQHGNNFGTSRYCSSEAECVETSDKFITWGWTDGNSKHSAAFIFKMAGRKVPQMNPDGGLLLIELHLPHRTGVWDEYPEFQMYQEGQFRFVENLPKGIRRELTVRLHGSYTQLPWCELQRWNDRSPNTRLELGSINIRELISNSRLVVHSYDSTGILETLSESVPTLCFWHGGLSHLRESAKPYYERLQEVGIMQDSPELAARMVAKVWDDVPAWWHGESLQSARRVFCDRYARVSTNASAELKEILDAG